MQTKRKVHMTKAGPRPGTAAAATERGLAGLLLLLLLLLLFLLLLLLLLLRLAVQRLGVSTLARVSLYPPTRRHPGAITNLWV